jgi:hypothetical protein
MNHIFYNKDEAIFNQGKFKILKINEKKQEYLMKFVYYNTDSNKIELNKNKDNIPLGRCVSDNIISHENQ